MSQVTRVWRIDPDTNIVLYHEDILHGFDGRLSVPGNCIQVVAPEISEGNLLKWESTVPRTNYLFGTEGTGTYQVLADHRKDKLYTTTNGQEYTIGADHELDGHAVSFDGVGDLPSWLTAQERPDSFHDWDGTDWVPDEIAIEKNKKVIERSWRDQEINRISWLRDRHRDELELDLGATLTEDQYNELQDYIQMLRDWPMNQEFPNQEARPDRPSWLSNL